jgi:hypothetical protein
MYAERLAGEAGKAKVQGPEQQIPSDGHLQGNVPVKVKTFLYSPLFN